jgi:hypothetical protein
MKKKTVSKINLFNKLNTKTINNIKYSNNLISVNSFDIFDTLITRKVKNPTDIFKIMESKCQIPDFCKIRIKAQRISNGTFNGIYEKLKVLLNYNDEDINKLKNIEIETELDNIIPIMANINLVKDGDILVSDMYLPEDIIRKLLNKVGFDKNVTIYISYNGKFTGTMWKYLTSKYKIKLHIGDNLHSDIQMSKYSGILSSHTKINNLSLFENLVPIEIANIFRTFRLLNPYPEGSNEFIIYNEQISSNIPILCFFAKDLHNIYLSENIDKLLLCTRDCCLIYKLLNLLYPSINKVTFYSSRILSYSNNEEYFNYVKNICTESSLVVDIWGTYQSGHSLFSKLFKKLPRMHFLNICYSIKRTNNYKNLTYSSKDMDVYLEMLNYDINGSIIDYKNNTPIRKPIEYNINYANIIHKTVDNFIEYIKNNNLLDTLLKFLDNINIHLKNKVLSMYLLTFQYKNILNIEVFH